MQHPVSASRVALLGFFGLLSRELLELRDTSSDYILIIKSQVSGG